MSKDVKQKDVPAGESGHTMAAVKKDVKPCCCNEVNLYLTGVEVVTETDAPIPLAGPLIGFFKADHVLVSAKTMCHSPTEPPRTWPPDGKAQEVPKGKPQHPHALLATITPNQECLVDCEVQIGVTKGTQADDILKKINEIEAQITNLTATLAADYAKITPGMSLLGSTLLNEINNTKKQITDLESEVNQLIALLFGTSDISMGPFSINFNGSLQCNPDLLDSMKNNDNPKKIDKNTVEIVKELSAHGGVWKLTFRAVKICFQEISTVPIAGH